MKEKKISAKHFNQDNLHYNILTIIAGILCIIVISDFNPIQINSQKKPLSKIIQSSTRNSLIQDHNNSVFLSQKCPEK